MSEPLPFAASARPASKSSLAPSVSPKDSVKRVKEGELDIVFDERSQTFGYVQPDRSSELIELSKEPSWRRIAYRR